MRLGATLAKIDRVPRLRGMRDAAVAEMRHGGRRLIAVDGDPHELGARAGKRRDLCRCPFDQAGP
ncbi:MAG: hypothetical protein ACR2KT_01220 [Methylocella sp.]